MQETQIIQSSKPKLKNPLCIVGLPGIGHVGRIAVDYIIHQLKATKFAELYSPFFFPFVVVHENQVYSLKNEFYYYKNSKGRDLILLIGDVQSYDPKGHYEIAGKILNFLQSLNCKEIITIGGFATGRTIENPNVFGVVTNPKYTKVLEKYNIQLKISGKITTIVGASGLLIGLGKSKGMEGFCLLGETSGQPVVTDPNAAEAVLTVLQKYLNINISLSELKQKVDQMHEFIKKLQEMQMKAVHEMQKSSKKGETPKYIG